MNVAAEKNLADLLRDPPGERHGDSWPACSVSDVANAERRRRKPMITEFREKGAPTKWTFTAARLEQNLRRRLESEDASAPEKLPVAESEPVTRSSARRFARRFDRTPTLLTRVGDDIEDVEVPIEGSRQAFLRDHTAYPELWASNAPSGPSF